MRLMVFFDLPVLTPAQRKRYTRFRRELIKEGFLMLQKSVYVKLAINDAATSGAIARLRKQCPSEGLVQVLKVTEKQYATMQTIAGDPRAHDEVDGLEELLVL